MENVPPPNPRGLPKPHELDELYELHSGNQWLRKQYLQGLKKALSRLILILNRVHRIHGVHAGPREAVFFIEPREFT